MNFYQEITLINHIEISPYFIWSKLYGQLHLALAEHKNIDQKVPFGFAFPEYHYDVDNGRIGLGQKLRVFAATEAELQALDLSKWLFRLMDYVHIQSIKLVPQNQIKGYAIYKRRQVKGIKRLQKEVHDYAMAYAKHHNLSLDEALAVYQHMQFRGSKLPFVEMRSLTSKQRFKLFIEKKVSESAGTGKMFTTYGLSTDSTIPEF